MTAIPQIICCMVLAVCLASAANACPQDQAIYGDADKSYELAFSPAASEAVMTSHQFSLTYKSTGLVMQGYVMDSENGDQSLATLLYQCPEGDVTGADIAACTVWEGAINLHGEDRLEKLPPSDQTAAGEILLAELAEAVRNSTVWGDDEVSLAPGDIFTLEGCAS